MKKLGMLLFSFALIFNLIPNYVFAANSTFDQDLQTYLGEVSATRGFDVSEEDIDLSLSAYEMSTSDFTTVDDMKTFLGDVIDSDLSNLDSIYDAYNLDETSLTQTLSEYGEDLNDYVYIDDLDLALDLYINGNDSGSGFDVDPTAILAMANQLGLSEEEMNNFKNYYLANIEYLSSSEVQTQVENLNVKMQALRDSLEAKVAADADYEPTDSEIAQMASLYTDMLSTLKLNAVFYQDNEPIAIEDLLKIDRIDSANISFELYDSNHVLLADMDVEDALSGLDMGDILDNITSQTSEDTVKTVNGGTLPKTATNYIPYSILGLFIAITGFVAYKKVRKDRIEING